MQFRLQVVLLRLEPEHFRVFPVQLHQLVMGALLNDLPVFQHVNLIRHFRGGQPVGNDDNGFVPAQIQHCMVKVVFRDGVQRA